VKGLGSGLALLLLPVFCGACALLDGYDWDRYTSSAPLPDAAAAPTSSCTLRVYSTLAVSPPSLQWGDTPASLSDGVATRASCPTHLSLNYALEPAGGSGQILSFPELSVPGTSGVLLLDSKGPTFVCTSNPTGDPLVSLKIVGKGGEQHELVGASPRWEAGEWLCWVGLPAGPYTTILATSGAGQPVHIDFQ
jgi:hypothetical protein